MSELSVRETAARAYTEHLIGWAMADDEWEAARSSTEVAAMGAALAAVADHDGLADVLAGALMQPTHAPLNQHDPETGDCVSCPWPVHALPAPDIAAHLADVVRAWIGGQG